MTPKPQDVTSLATACGEAHVRANIYARSAAVVATLTLIVLPAISAASVFVILNRRIFSDAAVALAGGVAIVSVIASVLSVRSMGRVDVSPRA